MKNSFISRLLAAVVLPAFITATAFTGCSSESSGGGNSGTGGAITSFEVELKSTELEAGSSTTLIAKATVKGDIDVTYSWEITDGADYATLSATDTATVTLTAKNSDTESHTVKVTVTASYGTSKETAYAYITVNAAKEDTTPVLKSVAITGTTEIASDGQGTLTATPSGDYLTDAEITYSWEITSEGSYASIDGEGASVTIKGANTTETEQSVTVKVTAKLGETSVDSSEYTVKVAAQGAVIKNELTGVAASALADTLDFDGSTTLTAEPTFTGNPTITYTWKITDGADYADLSATDTATVTLTAKNSDSESHTVKVTVTASDGENEKTADVSVTVGADTTPVLESVEITGTASIAATGSTTLTATPNGKNLDGAAISYTWEITSGGDYASVSGSGASATLTGKNTTTSEQSVTVKVTAKIGETSVDSSEYTVKVAAKAESGSTDKTGNVSIDVAITDETTYYTVNFVDATEEGYTSNESKTYKVKSGEKVTAPEWKRPGYLLTWTSSGDGVTPESAITADVTFTAKWSSSHTVTFKDSDTDGNDDVEVKVANGGTLSESDVPSWEKDHYTLSWTPALDFTTAVTADITYTAEWAEDAKFTVTFKDAEGGTNADDVQTIYSGEKASVPSWTKENYTLSWTSSVDGLSTDSAITADVTFTANWTEKPKETVITFVDSDSKFTASGNPSGYVTANGEKSYKSAQTYTTTGGTEISVSKGIKLNSKGYIELTLDSKYTVLLVQGTDKTTSKGLDIATKSGDSYGEAKNYAVVTTGSNVVSAELSAGTYKITNGGSETSVFAIILQI